MDDRPGGLVGRGPVLVLAPHADDEVLGCGALLADCWREGVPAHVVCLTDGAASHPRSATDLAALRRTELERTITILGGVPARDLTCLGHPDAALHDVPEGVVAAQLLALVDAGGARVLVVPSPLDPHCDHVTAAALADRVAAARPALVVLHYPIWSRWTGGGAAPPVPGSRRHAYPVTAPALKARAIAAHASQQGGVIRDDPDGFAMPEGFAAMFAQGPEIYDERMA
ncbi:LmbE family N-acetylglucosaminyl deacetylase [Hasllibacter halocynthiae]|uniref:LmbE family N-acetylglucosaminyl deacetylase n=1 Tax=Hasllibacter halocynthiae TaxID=595589 RepID=A0A2T0X4C6_9RHOB|nr:PIG-L deacetylase family protein [Hasllibacter halocynthiae]PRY93791.1 LmbE family N-acetylglucosaminyl deacetylase [Hasllibacter halocynthiae]